MPRKQHIVRLSGTDRRTLEAIARQDRQAAWRRQRAWILLLTDTAAVGPCLTDVQVASRLGVAPRTVARARQAWCQHQLGCLQPTPRTAPVPPKLSIAQQLEVAALACTSPPSGFARWSLRLLAGRVVEVGIVPTISHETVRQTLKKTGSSRGAVSGS